jgi:hypothetical protein
MPNHYRTVHIGTGYTPDRLDVLNNQLAKGADEMALAWGHDLNLATMESVEWPHLAQALAFFATPCLDSLGSAAIVQPTCPLHFKQFLDIALS